MSPTTEETNHSWRCSKRTRSENEVDFDIFHPPMTPVTLPSAEPACDSLANINDNDVIWAGRSIMDVQIGNTRFRKLLWEFLQSYLEAGLGERAFLCRTIVLIVRQRGGRFLWQDCTTEKLYEIGDAKAEALASHTFDGNISKGSIQGIQETPSISGISNKTAKSENEVDFDIFHPPMTPFTLPSAEPACDSLANVNDNDVIWAGRSIMDVHIGNTRFGKLLWEFRQSYLEAGLGERAFLCRTIVLIVRQRGGRFLQRAGKGWKFYEIGDSKAKDKAANAMWNTEMGIMKQSNAATLTQISSGNDHSHSESNESSSPDDLSESSPLASAADQYYQSVRAWLESTS
jgi:hypothetical protein